jgi:acyl dehydratase
MAWNDAPAGSLYADDVEVGSMIELGRWTIELEEALDFGRRWDPLPMHADPEAAAATPLGGVIASGFQLVAICQRLTVEAVWSKFVSGIGRGVDGVRWHRPTRPGETLRATFEAVELRSRGGSRATLVSHTEMRDEAGELVFEMSGETVIPLRPAD